MRLPKSALDALRGACAATALAAAACGTAQPAPGAPVRLEPVARLVPLETPAPKPSATQVVVPLVLASEAPPEPPDDPAADRRTRARLEQRKWDEGHRWVVSACGRG